MPIAGEKKWIVTSGFGTKSDIEEEIDGSLVDVALMWTSIGGTVCTYIGALMYNAVVTALGVACASLIGAQMYYSSYKEEMIDLCLELSDYTGSAKVEIEQLWQYHGGHKSWYPLKQFRIKSVN